MFPYVVAVLVFTSAIYAPCFEPDGDLVTSSDYLPCNSISGTISMCCATNRGSSSDLTPDICLPNGLCQNTFTNLTTDKPDTNYFRESCSENPWSSQYCLADICVSSSGGDAEITPCDGTATSATWCCGTHNTTCCGTGQEIVLAATLGSTTTSSSTSAPSTSSTAMQSSSTVMQSTSAAIQSSPTPTPSQTQAPSSGLSSGAKAGIGIGCAVLAVLVVVGVFYFFKRKNSTRAEVPAVEYVPGEYQDQPKELTAIPKKPLIEMEANGQITELP